ncbi:hypothetical protein LOD99_1851 [Oopsacas minuta]|uniref:Uncharacterized protein n=1 Tax=Oopsacas minuta TaxID=111878 RepID=A0AAV7K3R5_9METZ|nr:hypothetical protein LOD99_1851 [Oopsacas minuta]
MPFLFSRTCYKEARTKVARIVVELRREWEKGLTQGLTSPKLIKVLFVMPNIKEQILMTTSSKLGHNTFSQVKFTLEKFSLKIIDELSVPQFEKVEKHCSELKAALVAKGSFPNKSCVSSLLEELDEWTFCIYIGLPLDVITMIFLKR